MHDEASRELDNLPPDKRNSPEAQEMRIIISLDQQNLEEALSLSQNLCAVDPDNHTGFIQGAYCLHQLGRTVEAIDHIQSGPESLLDEPVYFYNLACYELALGKSQAAMTWLRQSIEMDRTLRGKALTDPDLVSVRDDI